MQEHHKIWSTSLTIAWPCIGDSWPTAQPPMDNRMLHEAAANNIHMSSRILLGRFKEIRIHTSGNEHPHEQAMLEPAMQSHTNWGPIAATWSHLAPSGAIWAIWGQVGPSEAILDYQGPLGWGNLSHLGLPTQTSCQLTHPCCPLPRSAHMQTALNANRQHDLKTIGVGPAGCAERLN